MTTPPTPQSDSAVPQPNEPVYAQSELYDSPADLARWPLLAPLLKTWQTEVWEKDHSESRGCWYYDQEAIRLQERHRLAVIVAAVAGTGAIVLAILQLGKVATDSLLNLEIACLVAAAITVVLGTIHSKVSRSKAHHPSPRRIRHGKRAPRLDAPDDGSGMVWVVFLQQERGREVFSRQKNLRSRKTSRRKLLLIPSALPAETPGISNGSFEELREP